MDKPQSYAGRVMSRAWEMTLTAFALRFERTITKAIWVGVALFAMWVFGWADLLVDKVGEITALLVALVIAGSAVLLWNVPRAAAALQMEAEDEITRLRNLFDDKAKRQAAINVLWQLRSDGISLRNRRVGSVGEFAGWRAELDSWRERVLDESGKVNPNLRNYLDRLDLTRGIPKNTVVFSAEHELQVRIATEILARLQEYLKKEL